MKIYVLYHASCHDGSGAHYAAWKHFGDKALYLPVQYHKPMPDIEDGSEVYILDFSYPRAQLEALKARVKKLVILDHHETAQEDLKDFPGAIFDMTKSGAVLAWEYFHPNEPTPELLNFIQDRDLWQWSKKGTRDVINALQVNGSDVRTWDEFSNSLSTRTTLGFGISMYQDGQIEATTKPDRVIVSKLDGYTIAVVNSTTLSSEIGNTLVTAYPFLDFALIYFVTAEGTAGCSLRSDGICNVAKIAKKFGGGGHAAAAGATLSLSQISVLYETGVTLKKYLADMEKKE